jgi:hypothetical protein
MAMFLGMISFLLALGLFAAALVLWHHGRAAGAGLVRVAGAVLGAGAVLTGLCTAYFMIAYRVQGDFESAYPAGSEMMMGPGMMRGMMGRGGMMGREGMMGPGMMGRGPAWSEEGEEGWAHPMRERWMRRMHPGMMPGTPPQTPPPAEPPEAEVKPAE